MGVDEFAPKQCPAKGDVDERCGLVDGHAGDHIAFNTCRGTVRFTPVVSSDDPVAHPPHYTRFPVEVIQITEHLNFCRGNVVKYVCRAGAKEGEDEVTPLRKAHWYLERELDRLDPEWRKR